MLLSPRTNSLDSLFKEVPWFSRSIGDKFGESLGVSQAPPSFWKVPGSSPDFPGSFRRTEWQSRGSPGSFPNFFLWEVPRTSPEVRRFPGLPRRSAAFFLWEVSRTSPEVAGLPGRSAVSLGSFPDFPRGSPNFPGGQPFLWEA